MADTIRDAERAQAILGDPVFARALEEMEAHIVQEWRNSDDWEEREKLHARLQAMVYIVDHLRIIMNEGLVEKHRREQEARII